LTKPTPTETHPLLLELRSLVNSNEVPTLYLLEQLTYPDNLPHIISSSGIRKAAIIALSMSEAPGDRYPKLFPPRTWAPRANAYTLGVLRAYNDQLSDNAGYIRTDKNTLWCPQHALADGCRQLLRQHGKLAENSAPHLVEFPPSFRRDELNMELRRGQLAPDIALLVHCQITDQPAQHLYYSVWGVLEDGVL